ncbi:type I restriction-modification system endonuclease [Poseidonibacter ostreae]|uniref:Type I restriction-modification system endonuclease n=1 Tax=Poseidonibacter ostreae TaxID=2654171 RepID=A0ABQ6VLW7_9BACT|nr:type I restriction-modification system endonuclease [Poseidonibacter ostreae]KAB7886397.1 type I restriction-modification system endonuclease [Poseidonibacter ostreae]KAB7891562.1 type I restriction-modification system endonuclease [Poseidonibacter ostreae]
MSESNFIFLEQHDPVFFQLASMAEQFFRADPNTTLIKIRQLSEAFSKEIASQLNISPFTYSNQNELLYSIDRQLSLDPVVKDLFHTIRKAGNKAVHEFNTNHKQAIDVLRLGHKLAVWYHRAFGNNSNFIEDPFILPSDPTEQLQKIQEEAEKLKTQLLEANQTLDENRELIKLQEEESNEFSNIFNKMESDKLELKKKVKEQEKELESTSKAFDEKLEAISKLEKDQKEEKELNQALKRKVKSASSKIHLTEDETREIIDIKLNEAGWIADTHTLAYAKGTRPKIGKNLAIAEWPCYNPHTKKNTRADYVFFIGLKPVAVIEAKKFGNDVADDLRQAEEYSRDINLESIDKISKNEGVNIELDQWLISSTSDEKYTIPLAYSTNGREYQKQIETKSGIWFRDLRGITNKPRAIVGWPTPDEIKKLLLRDENAIIDKIKEDHWGTLELRNYQKDAIHKTEDAILNKQRQILIAMATGTGKTRTVIALMYRLLKAGYFNRILFLVDRGALGKQTQDTFAEIRPDGILTFDEIYDIKELKDKSPDTKTRVHVATVQSMVKRVLASDKVVPIGQYDCIIVDEAHRGYTLDKEMTEGEIELRDFNEYVSAYRQVLDYFDAIRIGLTATPATHTVDIFGAPVYTYSYREAVIDGYLIDSEPPYSFDTQLSKHGIHFEKEDEVTVFNQVGEVRTEILEDEMDFEIEDFNRKVLSPEFNRVICETLAANYLDPTDNEKTLIFCVNDNHAQLVVEEMKKALDKFHGDQPNKAVMKITGKIRDPLGAIREYKNELLPNIAVTVDLLTTGIDVPEIVNLVFLRRVRSRILYEQMKGRATRLCPDINKDIFRIFDAVSLYKVLEKVDTMKPIVQKVSVPITQLIDDLNNEASYQYSGETFGETYSKTHADDVHEQLIVKLQRITRRTKKIEEFPEAKKAFDLLNILTRRELSCEFNELPQKIKELTARETGIFFKNNPDILGFMVNLRAGLKIGDSDIVISNHEDKLLGINRGYGTDTDGNEIQKPEDYLESFNVFINENKNKIAAIKAVLTRPRNLTRADLKSLRLILSEHNFNETHLHEAWKKAKNEDIAATIIGYIRSSALGSPLIPYSQRVETALAKIKTSQTWNNNQLKWLDLLAKQIKKNIIIDEEALQNTPFKEKGGRKQLERFFDNKLDEILDNFDTYIWEQSA